MLELASRDLRVTFSPLGARLVSVYFDGADMLAGGGTDEELHDGSEAGVASPHQVERPADDLAVDDDAGNRCRIVGPRPEPAPAPRATRQAGRETSRDRA